MLSDICTLYLAYIYVCQTLKRFLDIVVSIYFFVVSRGKNSITLKLLKTILNQFLDNFESKNRAKLFKLILKNDHYLSRFVMQHCKHIFNVDTHHSKISLNKVKFYSTNIFYFLSLIK